MRFFPIIVLLLGATEAWSQTNRGSLRVSIVDPSGAAVGARVELTSEANGYQHAVESDSTGLGFIPLIPYGVYQVRIDLSGLAPFREDLEILSEVPVDERVRRAIATMQS